MAHVKAKAIPLINIHNLVLEDHCEKTKKTKQNKIKTKQ